jgi:hypothetical protein
MNCLVQYPLNTPDYFCFLLITDISFFALRDRHNHPDYSNKWGYFVFPMYRSVKIGLYTQVLY